MRGPGGVHQGAGQPGHGGQGTAAHSGEVGQLAGHQCYGAEEPKLNSLLVPEPKLRIAAPAPTPAPAPAPFYNLFIFFFFIYL